MKLAALTTTLLLLFLTSAIPVDAGKGGNPGGSPPPACSDSIDNDGDGLTDYPNDPGCSSASDTDEFNACVTVADNCLYTCPAGDFTCNGVAYRVNDAQATVDKTQWQAEHANGIATCFVSATLWSAFFGSPTATPSHLTYCMTHPY